MRALASHERLTFRRAATSLAVSRGEMSWCGLFIGVFLILKSRSLRVFGVTPRRTRRGPLRLMRSPTLWRYRWKFWPSHPDCEENMRLVGGARPKCGLDLLYSPLR